MLNTVSSNPKTGETKLKMGKSHLRIARKILNLFVKGEMGWQKNNNAANFIFFSFFIFFSRDLSKILEPI